MSSELWDEIPRCIVCEKRDGADGSTSALGAAVVVIGVDWWPETETCSQGPLPELSDCKTFSHLYKVIYIIMYAHIIQAGVAQRAGKAIVCVEDRRASNRNDEVADNKV